MDEGSAGVGEKSFSEELCKLGFVSEERAGDVDAFASDDDDLLACIS